MIPVPEEIEELGVNCPTCNSRVRPDLWLKHEQPFGPIFPNGTYGEKGAWVQQSVRKKCDCGTEVDIPLTPRRLRDPVFFYGDEAVRDEGKVGFYVYSLIGATSGPHQEWATRLKAIKQKYVPSLRAEDWVLHATKITNGYYREKTKSLCHLGRGDVRNLLSEVALAIRDFEQFSWNMCIVTPFLRAPDKKSRKKMMIDIREASHATITSAAIFRATKQSLRPKFIFDATRKIQQTPHIEHWSYDTFENRKHFLAYELISHGNTIAPPEFAKPGSHPSLELSDVHAFSMARKMFLLSRGKEPEFEVDQFGQFYYMVQKGPNHADYYVGSDIPDRYFSGLF